MNVGGGGSLSMPFTQSQVDAIRRLDHYRSRLKSRDWIIVEKFCGEGWSMAESVRAATVCHPSGVLLRLIEALDELVAARRGQGAFRFMVMDAYERRCAITGERTLPVLEAAHIRPFADHATHEIQNGILMRSDVHRLYDLGLVTVDPDLRFRVSPSIERDYSNGKIYYALDGSAIRVPADENRRPDPDALAWHTREVFRP